MAIHTTLQRANAGTIITFDAVTKRSETNTATVTEHPVEKGFVISDHVTVDNVKIVVEGIISAANNSGEEGSRVSDPVGSRLDMKEAFNNREEVKLLTSEESYPAKGHKLIITSLVFEKTSPTKGFLGFVMNLEQIVVVSTGTTTLDVEEVNKEILEEAKRTEELGTKNVERTGSQAEQFYDSLTGKKPTAEEIAEAEGIKEVARVKDVKNLLGLPDNFTLPGLGKI